VQHISITDLLLVAVLLARSYQSQHCGAHRPWDAALCPVHQVASRSETLETVAVVRRSRSCRHRSQSRLS